MFVPFRSSYTLYANLISILLVFQQTRAYCNTRQQWRAATHTHNYHNKSYAQFMKEPKRKLSQTNINSLSMEKNKTGAPPKRERETQICCNLIHISLEIILILIINLNKTDSRSTICYTVHLRPNKVYTRSKHCMIAMSFVLRSY